MIGAATRYRELLTQLLVSRELAGGKLPEDVESQFVEDLDRIWWALTSEEQAAIETTLNDAVPQTAPDLDMADTKLTVGAHDPPRQAA